jgi:hypothetical protein
MSDNEFLSRITDYTREIEVSYEKLWLDPNNPRFRSHRKNKIKRENYFTEKTISSTKKLMNDPKLGFDIPGMMSDFLVKGFIDGDAIIVIKDDVIDGYIVCEGNRRLAAVQNLLAGEDVEKYKKIRPGIVDELSTLPVIEVIPGDLIPEKVHLIIDQMLGIRHLNQLQHWSPFARGSLLYQDYLKIDPLMTKDTFVWDESPGKCIKGEQIAANFLDGLDPSIKEFLPKKSKKKIGHDDVKKVLRTIRVMEQLAGIEGVYMKGKYYSLFEALCTKSSSQIQKFIPINPKTFLLEPEAITLVIDLCKLENKNREDAPISDDKQWRSLSNILNPVENEEDEIKEMLAEVTIKGRKPDDVWFEREAKRQSFTWAKWLKDLQSLVGEVKLGDIPMDNQKIKEVLGEMWDVLEVLRARKDGDDQIENN